MQYWWHRATYCMIMVRYYSVITLVVAHAEEEAIPSKINLHSCDNMTTVCMGCNCSNWSLAVTVLLATLKPKPTRMHPLLPVRALLGKKQNIVLTHFRCNSCSSAEGSCWDGRACSIPLRLYLKHGYVQTRKATLIATASYVDTTYALPLTSCIPYYPFSCAIVQ